jgi:large repetitive protein
MLVIGVLPVTLAFPSPALARLGVGAPKPPGQWSMFMNGPMHRGRSPFAGPPGAHLAWQISSQTNYGGPVIGRDGTIYQGTDLHQLLALSPTGVLKWSIATGRAVGSTPAIMPDGRTVFVDEGGTIYAANPDGSLSWTLPTGAGGGSANSPTIGVDGTIYTSTGPTVYALHPDGTILWTYDLGGNALGPVSVRPDGIVYAVSSLLFAIDPTGSLLWKTDALSLSSSSVGPDGTIYANSSLPTVYAFRPNGTVKWTYEADTCCAANVLPAPAIGPDGTIYAGETLTDSGAILALNPNGTLKWEADYGHAPTPPVIDRDGTIYYGGGSSTASVFAVGPDGSLKWQYDTPDGYVRTPVAIGAHHRLYAGGSGGIYAIGP